MTQWRWWWAQAAESAPQSRAVNPAYQGCRHGRPRTDQPHDIKPSQRAAETSFLSSLLFSSSECKGDKHTSEDSSEVAFLLVENYFLTTPSRLRLAREFLATHCFCLFERTRNTLLFIAIEAARVEVKKRSASSALGGGGGIWADDGIPVLQADT
jgi:hypothetical protein